MTGRELEEPRGKMTPFGFYVFVCMKEAKKRHPDKNLVFQMFEDVCLTRWEAMSDFHKKRFVAMSEKDGERFNKEMADFQSQKQVIDEEKKAKEKEEKEKKAKEKEEKAKDKEEKGKKAKGKEGKKEESEGGEADKILPS